MIIYDSLDCITYLDFYFENVLYKFGQNNFWITENVPDLLVDTLAQQSRVLKYVVPHVGPLKYNTASLLRTFLTEYTDVV